MDRISPTELAELLTNHPMTVLDVRTAAEFEAAHIPGSVWVSLDELRADATTVASLLPEHAVVVCRSGQRATQACEVLAALGRDDLRVLDGGIREWERGGHAVDRARERWDLERQVRLVAGGLVLSSVLASLLWRPARLVAGAVGAGLTVAALTNTCAMGAILAKVPYNRGGACDGVRLADRFAHLAGHGRVAP